jgi:polyribonucleotide nucleotidyltransferase
MVENITEDAEVGKTYKATVVSTRDFGAFVEILPGTEALVHVSELAEGFVENVTDEVKVGDEIEVKVINVDDSGKVKASRKAVLDPNWEPAPERSRSGGGGRGGRGGGRGGRGGGGGRGGKRG